MGTVLVYVLKKTELCDRPPMQLLHIIQRKNPGRKQVGMGTVESSMGRNGVIIFFPVFCSEVPTLVS